MTSVPPPLRKRMRRALARPVRRFLEIEGAGGIALLVAAAAALAWANSPFGETYDAFWDIELGVGTGDLHLTDDLRHWVNDGLMALFFFVVGLEIKRELVTGELNDARKAMLPAIAALGGMAGPALLYAAFNADGPNSSGWGIPMATDIAFAVGVLVVLGNRIPAGLKVFLLSLAIVDDIGAILVIALFYSSGIEVGWLAAAGVLLLFVVFLRSVRVGSVIPYAIVGAAVWFATLESGVHATIAGVILGLLTPARAGPDEPSVAERLEDRLHPWTSFFVVPVFALANAGVVLGPDSVRAALGSRVALGIVVGLVLGKIVGISAASWLAVKLRLGVLPDEVGWRHLFGASAVAGIGFTVSLFIANLAFDDAGLVATAKIAILAASVIAGTIGALVLLAGTRQVPSEDL